MIDWHDLYYLHHRKTCAWATAQARRLHPSLAHYEAEQRAEDAVQTAWMTLLARGLGPDDTMPGLLMSIAVRTLYADAKRQALRQRHDHTDALERMAPLGGKLVPELEHVASVLTEHKLEAWVLRNVQKMTFQEIADEMNLASKHAASGLMSETKRVLKRDS